MVDIGQNEPEFHGQRVIVRRPRPHELAALATMLSEAHVLGRFGIPRAPTVEELARGLMPDGRSGKLEPVNTRVVDHAGALVGVTIEYGWDYFRDPVREIDVAFPAAVRDPALFLDAIIALVLGLLEHTPARQLRWRVDAEGGGARFARTFERLGATLMKDVMLTNPLTGERRPGAMFRLSRADVPKARARMLGESSPQREAAQLAAVGANDCAKLLARIEAEGLWTELGCAQQTDLAQIPARLERRSLLLWRILDGTKELGFVAIIRDDGQPWLEVAALSPAFDFAHGAAASKQALAAFFAEAPRADRVYFYVGPELQSRRDQLLAQGFEEVTTDAARRDGETMYCMLRAKFAPT